MQTVSGTFTYNTEHAHRFILILDSKISHMTDYDLKSVRNDIIKKWRTCIIIWLILSVYDKPCSEDSRFFWILLSVGWRLGTRAIWSIMSWRNCASRTPLKGGYHFACRGASCTSGRRSSIHQSHPRWNRWSDIRVTANARGQMSHGHFASDTFRLQTFLKTFGLRHLAAPGHFENIFSSCF